MKLNIGCGKKILEGYINVDIKDFGQDIVEDIFIYLPSLKENSVNHIRAEHIIEHFNQDEALKLLDLIWRIIEPNGELYIIVPHLKNERAWILAHKTFYNEFTFKVLDGKGWKIKEIVVNDRLDIHCKMLPIK